MNETNRLESNDDERGAGVVSFGAWLMLLVLDTAWQRVQGVIAVARGTRGSDDRSS